jgi:hypothetical protein
MTGAKIDERQLAIQASPLNGLLPKIKGVIGSERKTGVVAKTGASVVNDDTKLDGIGGFGAVMQEGSTKAMACHITLQGTGAQQGNQPQRLQEIRLSSTVGANQQRESARLENNILQGAEASNVNLLNAISSRVLPNRKIIR